MSVFVIVEVGGFVVAAGVPEDGVVDLGGGDFGSGGGVDFGFAEGGVAVVFEGWCVSSLTA